MNASSLSPESQISEEEFEMMRELFRRSLSSNLEDVQQINKETATKSIDDDKTIAESKDLNSKDVKSKDLKSETVKSNDQTNETKETEKSTKNSNEIQIKLRRSSSARLSQSSALIEKVLHSNKSDSINQTEKSIDNEQKMLLLLTNGKDGQQISKEELEKRQNYLRKQRDKLIELKRQERSKQIIEKSTNLQTNRPKSARALRSSLKKDFVNEDDDNDKIEQTKVKIDENKENKKNGYSKMLAARLKAELIGGNVQDVQITIQPTSSQKQI